jgi:hypothetical protein
VAFRRTATCALLIAGLTLLPVTPIAAVTPGFELAADVDGSTIHVTLTFEPVPNGFAWGSLEASGVLEELAGLVPVDLVDDGRTRAPAEPVLIPLLRSGERIYTGTAKVPAGRWAVVAWPLEPDLGAVAEVVTVRDPHPDGCAVDDAQR